ncbi:Dihydrofolate synthase @ Folylpolyglutamate synthase [hydrothermal vent metagenome]|uniref:Dihydrofolate synthase @ Folylpolyglutamate synthase n=1 Tax=hydrothermal vent metagenome TaxID=652676 RepID=A0A3B1B4E8_9ZZZZ
MRFQSLNDWLDWQALLHPSTIELGLERVATVWQQLHPNPFPSLVITVAGTNGKGSCTAMLGAILRAAGYRTGCYSSPHLLRYNERIRIDGAEASDGAICQAFERIDQARDNTSLTYFEFGTLAALEIFAISALDVVILEVGLGGRLDAVNIIDADVALITSVDMDHMDWLGDDLEQIALEKCGVMRANRPAVFGGNTTPASLVEYAESLQVPLSVAGEGFNFRATEHDWDWVSEGKKLCNLALPSLQGCHQLQNAAAVIKVVDLLADRLTINHDAICQGLANTHLPGRFQVIPGSVDLILDVAHNPAAAQVLADTLQQLPCTGRTLAVFAMLSDKDVVSVTEIMSPHVNGWYLGALEDKRTLSAHEIQQQMHKAGVIRHVQPYQNLMDAYFAAQSEAVCGDRVLVFGSFIAAAGVLDHESTAPLGI